MRICTSVLSHSLLIMMTDAQAISLCSAHAMKKDELVDAIDSRLSSNQSTYSTVPALKDYYSHRANSPVKREPSTAVAKTGEAPVSSSNDAATTKKEPKPRARRQTNAGGENADSLVPARSPRSVQRVASGIPLPSSPTAVTNFVERQSALFTRRVSKTLDRSHIPEYAEATRHALSSPHGITSLFLLAEGMSLMRETLPWRHAFSVPVPFAGAVGLDGPVNISFPDFFVLITAGFWSPTMLWLTLSLFMPLAIGWLFNLTRAAGVSRRHSYSVDPLASNIAKGIGAWLVFSKNWGMGTYLNPRTVGRVEGAIWGGAAELQISAGLGALAGLYEAVLRK